MERLWAATGLSVVAIVWGVVFGLENHDIGHALGSYVLNPCIMWLLPTSRRLGSSFCLGSGHGAHHNIAGKETVQTGGSRRARS